MRWTPELDLFDRGDSHALGVVLLGQDHPLVRASELARSMIRQSGACLAALVGATVAGISGAAWAWAVILGAGMVLLILTVLAAGFQQCKRDQAIELILRGYQNVPIAAIQAQRRRLLSGPTRRRLACCFEQTAEEQSQRGSWQARGAAPRFDPQVIVRATEDLLAVARVLDTESVSPQGVARAERLITDATSPLHGHDAIALRAELRRIRHDLLAG
jgi:hypothetical protein